MQILRGAVIVFCALLFCAFAKTTTANEWNKRTSVTFSSPVQIPGKVLRPGTYIFKLAPSNSDRHIVQVWNADGTRLLDITMTLPEVREHASNVPVFDFEKRSGKMPETLKSWFYQGDTDGEEFVYLQNSNSR